jgi:hypothetical protein
MMTPPTSPLNAQAILLLTFFGAIAMAFVVSAPRALRRIMAIIVILTTAFVLFVELLNHASPLRG